MLVMNAPAPALHRLVLVPQPRRTAKPAVATAAAARPVRRYRLARVARDGEDRFSHLRRAYD